MDSPGVGVGNLARPISRGHPGREAAEGGTDLKGIDRLFGSDRLRLAVEREGGIEALLPVLAKESEQFRQQAEKYWIYK